MGDHLAQAGLSANICPAAGGCSSLKTCCYSGLAGWVHPNAFGQPKSGLLAWRRPRACQAVQAALGGLRRPRTRTSLSASVWCRRQAIQRCTTGMHLGRDLADLGPFLPTWAFWEPGHGPCISETPGWPWPIHEPWQRSSSTRGIAGSDEGSQTRQR